MSNSTVNKIEDNWPYKIQLWRKEFCPKTFGGGLIKWKETYFSFLFAKKHTYLGRFCYKVGDSFLLFRKLLSFMQLVSEGHPPLKKKALLGHSDTQTLCILSLLLSRWKGKWKDKSTKWDFSLCVSTISTCVRALSPLERHFYYCLFWLLTFREPETFISYTSMV